MSRLSQFSFLVEWQARVALPFLPLAVVLQSLVGAGSVIGFSLLLPHIDPSTALYLATGGPTIALIVIGLSFIPQSVAQANTSGVYDYFGTLPIPRLGYLLAEMTILLTIALPGAGVSLVIATLRFGLHLHPSLSLIPAVLLVVLTATSVGFTLALSLRAPQLITLASNGLLFFVMLFSPINYPPSRLPTWLADIHRVLPMEYMANLMRASLSGSGPVLGATAVLAVWSTVAITAALALASRTV